VGIREVQTLLVTHVTAHPGPTLAKHDVTDSFHIDTYPGQLRELYNDVDSDWLPDVFALRDWLPDVFALRDWLPDVFALRDWLPDVFALRDYSHNRKHLSTGSSLNWPSASSNSPRALTELTDY
jgi:hypothetical protein